MGNLHNLPGLGNVFFKGQGGAIDHHGGEAAGDGGHHILQVRAVIQVQAHGDLGIVGLLDDHFGKALPGKAQLIRVDLHDHRGIGLLSSLDTGPEHHGGAGVEGGDGKMVGQSGLADFRHVTEHNMDSP